jgi:hypothetical protein
MDRIGDQRRAFVFVIAYWEHRLSYAG